MSDLQRFIRTGRDRQPAARMVCWPPVALSHRVSVPTAAGHVNRKVAIAFFGETREIAKRLRDRALMSDRRMASTAQRSTLSRSSDVQPDTPNPRDEPVCWFPVMVLQDAKSGHILGAFLLDREAPVAEDHDTTAQQH